MSDKYRLSVGVVLFNNDGKVWVGARADKPDYQWQFPHGGIDNGEDALHAAKRELFEETHVRSVEYVGRTNELTRYDFPPDVIEKFQKLGRTNVGQEQYWFLFYFTGKESEIKLDSFEEIEFKAWKWEEIDVVTQNIVGFKKQVYKIVAETFKPMIKGFLKK